MSYHLYTYWIEPQHSTFRFTQIKTRSKSKIALNTTIIYHDMITISPHSTIYNTHFWPPSTINIHQYPSISPIVPMDLPFIPLAHIIYQASLTKRLKVLKVIRESGPWRLQTMRRKPPDITLWYPTYFDAFCPCFFDITSYIMLYLYISYGITIYIYIYIHTYVD